MKLNITTLSPIHIGNGEKYNGLSYLVDKKSTPHKLCYFDFDTIKSVFSLTQLQEFSSFILENKYPKMYNFVKKLKNNDTITNKIISKSIYKVDLLFKEDPQQRKFLGDIDAFIKHNNKPYIPGTEIKGAIRTAVFYRLLNNEYEYFKEKVLALKEQFINVFKLLSTLNKRGNEKLNLRELSMITEDEFKKIFGDRKLKDILEKVRNNIDPQIKINNIKKYLVNEAAKIEEELQIRLFRSPQKNDAKYDLLKFLYISDSDTKEPSNCLFVSDLETLNISRGVGLFQEFCKKEQIFTCQGFKLEYNETLLKKLGFTDNQKSLISNIENIFQSCYEFTKKLIEEELSYPLYPNKIKEKLKIIKEKNKPDSPVIRIGKNQGYLSITINMIVKEKDKDIYDKVLCHATKNTSYTEKFPKTRRIVNLHNEDSDTCGWVKLKLI